MTVDQVESPAAAPPSPRRRPRWLVPLLVVVLLAQMGAAMVVTAVQQTPTIDEPVYVGAAITYLEQRSLRYNPEHPPLGKMIMAVGVAFADPQLDPAFRGNQTELGRHVLYEAGNDPYELMFLARLPMIILTLLFGLVVFAFARDLFGPAGGLLALALYTLSPDVIAHGSLATLDVPAVGFLLTAVWLTWRARARPYLYLPLAGLALGAAVATRMNALPAVPLLMLLAFLALKRWRGLAAAAGVAVIAFAVIWVSYLIVDPWLGWIEPTGMPVVSGLRGLLVDVLPVPEPYRDGMRIQFAFEDRAFRGFLFGELYRGSLWYYLPAALLVKTPIGTMVLGLAGTAALFAVPRLRIAALYLVLPVGLLMAVAMTGSRDFGTRYVIFVPIFGAVIAAAVVAVKWRWARLTAAALVLFVAVSSLRTFPYYLPYSNEAFGGPSATHLRLHDSNVDWGQDLGRLADRLRERYPGEKVWLVYRGAGMPAAYGITATSPTGVPDADIRGLLVVSDSSAAKAGSRLKALIASSGEPIDEVGHSITIYRR
ncbi:ArnT family glycosyltransferase [Amorphoplanes digitatis]|uniref:4-amino-4-deoxy-L-arabinose transferase-like glycosyltransferase n=1 Tax=Actinoplanes digitatis TaxID=1868 RepID=A0A7W7HXQ0_9ACTN|nr:phospholipid carrier-dependent glycosyltransferase [Actinoplanes digitatis]MBB4762692.1 4-amino-4-deoxy-L-arabinose transferase-like glycosyltransferase [Actinoplanes digitatis]GID91812.1 glycosyl transferase [Actinoplanes digitatis]